MADSESSKENVQSSEVFSNVSSVLKTKLEGLKVLKEDMTEQVSSLLEKIRQDTQTALEGENSPPTETLQELHTRLDAVALVLKNKCSDTCDVIPPTARSWPALTRQKSSSCGNVACAGSDVSNRELQCRLEALEKYVELLHHTPQQNQPQGYKNMEDSLAMTDKSMAGIRNAEAEFEKKMRQKLASIENMMQQKYDTMEEKHTAIRNENIKLKGKVLNLEQTLKRKMDMLKEEISELKSSSLCTGDAAVNVKGHVTDGTKTCVDHGIDMRPVMTVEDSQNTRSRLELENDVVQLKGEISSLKNQLSDVLGKSSQTSIDTCHAGNDFEEGNEDHIAGLNEVKEQFSQLKMEFMCQIQNLQRQLGIDSLKSTHINSNTLPKQLAEKTENLAQNAASDQASNLVPVGKKSKDQMDKKLQCVQALVESLTERMEENSHEMQQCWKRISEVEASEQDLHAEMEEQKYMQLNDERVKIESEVGKLNLGVEVLMAQMEDMDEKIADLRVDVTRSQEAWNIFSVHVDERSSKKDVTEALKDVGLKIVLMKQTVVNRLDHLETLCKDLAAPNGTVTSRSRQELSEEITYLKAALENLQSAVLSTDEHAEDRVRTKTMASSCALNFNSMWPGQFQSSPARLQVAANELYRATARSSLPETELSSPASDTESATHASETESASQAAGNSTVPVSLEVTANKARASNSINQCSATPFTDKTTAKSSTSGDSSTKTPVAAAKGSKVMTSNKDTRLPLPFETSCPKPVCTVTTHLKSVFPATTGLAPADAGNDKSGNAESLNCAATSIQTFNSSRVSSLLSWTFKDQATSKDQGTFNYQGHKTKKAVTRLPRKT